MLKLKKNKKVPFFSYFAAIVIATKSSFVHNFIENSFFPFI